MDVIPVLDLMNGEVVHARRGERAAYRPIRSTLTPSADPLDICRAIMALAPFRRLYVADLDAIRRRGSNDPAIAALAASFPALEIWVDRGDCEPETLRRRVSDGPGVSVVGAESFCDLRALEAAIDAASGVLSLDHDAGGRLGPSAIYDDPAHWPDEVIVMTLARVGAGEGPDLERLSQAIAIAGGRRIHAAGGVRGADDLAALSERGVSGALVASALHDGRLTPAELRAALAAPPRTPPRP